MRFHCLLAAIVFLPLPSLAQGIRLGETEFLERISETSKVSGDIVMGVMLTGDQPSDQPPSVVTASVPSWSTSTEATPVCVRLVSKDGRYEAENTYLVEPGYGDDTAPFPYMGEHADFLAERPAVALAKPGRCGDRSDTALPAIWRARADSPPEMLNIYLNTAGNPASMALGRGDRFFEPCTDISELSGLKYTALCSVPVSDLPVDGPARLTFFITRSNTEESFTLEVLPVSTNG
jgi:hypothetical protein